MEKKVPLNSLFLLLSYFPSRDVGFSSNSRYKIVALKMHETFNHPEWWIDLFFFFFPTTLPPAKTRQNQYPLHLLTLTPSPSSPHHSGQRITGVVTKQEVLSWWQGRGHSQREVSILQEPRGSPRFNFILLSGQCACSGDRVSHSQELIVQEVKCRT